MEALDLSDVSGPLGDEVGLAVAEDACPRVGVLYLVLHLRSDLLDPLDVAQEVVEED